MLWEDRNAACLLSLSLILGNGYRQGKVRKRCPESTCCCPGSCTLHLHLHLQVHLSSSVFWKEEMWTWSQLLAGSGFLYTAVTVIEVKKKKKWWEGGIHCDSELIMESFLLSIFCNPIRRHFLFKLPHSFHFSYNVYYIMYQSGLLMGFCFERAWLLATIIYEMEPS